MAMFKYCAASLLLLLAACSSEQYQDPRYLYRQSPGGNAAIRKGNGDDRNSGRLYNENGQPVEAMMPSSTDPSLPGDMNDDGFLPAGFHK